jgi:hypothetical protein
VIVTVIVTITVTFMFDLRVTGVTVTLTVIVTLIASFHPFLGGLFSFGGIVSLDLLLDCFL